MMNQSRELENTWDQITFNPKGSPFATYTACFGATNYVRQIDISCGPCVRQDTLFHNIREEPNAGNKPFNTQMFYNRRNIVSELSDSIYLDLGHWASDGVVSIFCT